VEEGPAEGLVEEEEEEGEWEYTLELSEEWAQHFKEKEAQKKKRRKQEYAAAARGQKRPRAGKPPWLCPCLLPHCCHV
jgi:hypothetical protein